MRREPTGRLEDMVVFARVVEGGSLTRAARALGTTRSAVSKALSRLELRLGARLLNRTTRELSITAAGKACYAHCARIAEEARAAERAAASGRGEPHGTLKVSCSTILGLMLAPQLAQFAAAHPRLSVELNLSESVIDLVREGIDVALRLGRLSSSSLVAKKLASYRRAVCASPSYLARSAPLRSAADLAQHDCLLRTGDTHWRLKSGPLAVRGTFHADSPELLKQAAIAGLGVAVLPSFLIAADVAAARLVLVLEELAEPAGIYAVYPHARHLPQNVRAFVDAMAHAAAALPV